MSGKPLGATPLGVFPPHLGVKLFTTSLHSGNVSLFATASFCPVIIFVFACLGRGREQNFNLVERGIRTNGRVGNDDVSFSDQSSPPEITFVPALIYGTWAPNTRQNGAYNIGQRGKGTSTYDVHTIFDPRLQNIFTVCPKIGCSCKMDNRIKFGIFLVERHIWKSPKRFFSSHHKGIIPRDS